MYFGTMKKLTLNILWPLPFRPTFPSSMRAKASSVLLIDQFHSWFSPFFILLIKSSILFVNILYILYYTFQQYFAVESFMVLNL
jgi:hypothetical protein